MKKINERIQKITSQGQITLPISWRRQFKVSQIILRLKGKTIEVEPINLSYQNNQDTEYTVFDAIRDNKGNGIKAQDILKIIEKNDI